MIIGHFYVMLVLCHRELLIIIYWLIYSTKILSIFCVADAVWDYKCLIQSLASRSLQVCGRNRLTKKLLDKCPGDAVYMVHGRDI